MDPVFKAVYSHAVFFLESGKNHLLLRVVNDFPVFIGNIAISVSSYSDIINIPRYFGKSEVYGDILRVTERGGFYPRRERDNPRIFALKQILDVRT